MFFNRMYTALRNNKYEPPEGSTNTKLIVNNIYFFKLVIDMNRCAEKT